MIMNNNEDPIGCFPNTHWAPLPLVGVLVLVTSCQLPCHSSQRAATNRSQSTSASLTFPPLLSWRPAAEGSTHTHTVSRPSLDPL